MSLFVGNISKKVSRNEFEATFKKFGRCKIDLRGNKQSGDKQYAFVQFESDRDAERSKAELHNSDMAGLKLNIEWSKNSGRFGEDSNRRRDFGGGRRDFDRDRSWGRRDRRSYSRDRRRESPDYTQDLDAPPMCKRDIILLSRLEQKRQRHEERMEREGGEKGEIKVQNGKENDVAKEERPSEGQRMEIEG